MVIRLRRPRIRHTNIREILTPIRVIVITINYNIPEYRLKILDLIDFPWKPLNTSQLHHFPNGFSWSELRNQLPPSPPSEPDNDSPVEELAESFRTDNNRNPDIDDVDWSD